MVYSFARVSAALTMDRKDVFPIHHRLWLRLTEKGGKHHEMPCHHNLEEYLPEYLEASGIEDGPIFRTLRGRTGQLNEPDCNAPKHCAWRNTDAAMQGLKTRPYWEIIPSEQRGSQPISAIQIRGLSLPSKWRGMPIRRPRECMIGGRIK
ncbi:MAG: hypothetical protein AAF224_13600 [Pseudomonadota bacterium]